MKIEWEEIDGRWSNIYMDVDCCLCPNNTTMVWRAVGGEHLPNCYLDTVSRTETDAHAGECTICLKCAQKLGLEW